MKEIDLDEEFGPEGLPEKVEVINFPESEKIGGLIADLKTAIEAIETNVSVNVGTSELAEVVKSLEAWQITTVEAINAIPQPVEPKDYTKNLEEIKKALKKDVDFAPVIDALSRLEGRETKVEVPGFTELKEAIALVGEKIDNIKGFEIPEKLIYKDQLKVSVDRIGGGGGIVDTSSLATSAKQDTIVTALGEYAIAATSVDASSSGDNTIVSITNTPKLYYVCLSANGANSADVTAIVKIGATTKYKVSLKAGAIWARNIGAEKRYVSGSVGEDIIVNLSAAQTVHVSVEYADAA